MSLNWVFEKWDERIIGKAGNTHFLKEIEHLEAGKKCQIKQYFLLYSNNCRLPEKKRLGAVSELSYAAKAGNAKNKS